VTLVEPSTKLALALLPDGSVQELAEVDFHDIDDIRKRDGAVVWLDISNPGDADLDILDREFGVHPLAREDLQRRDQRPKVDTYPDQTVVVTYEVLSGGGAAAGTTMAEHHLFVGSRYLVSVHWVPSPVIASVQNRFRQRAPTVGAASGGLLYAILDEVADGYFPVLDVMAERIDDLEDRVIEGLGGRETLREVLDLKRQLLDLRRVLGPMRDSANSLLRRDNDLIEEAALPYFQDLFDHLIRILDQVDLYRDLVASTLEANLAVTSNSLNAIMKRLTAFTVLLMVPTLIAGIYGMNFRYMPELGQQWGYPAVLVIMAVSIVVVGLFFRSKDWF
jgi:magnesium transporter